MNGNEHDTLQEAVCLTLPSDEIQRIFDKAKTLKDLNPMYSIRPKYKKFQQGDKCRGVLTGFKKIPSRHSGEIEAAIWVDEKGESYFSQAVILVDELQKANIAKGTAIEITCTGQKGSALNFDIHILG